MDDADRFDPTCVERGWRSARLDDDAYLFDEHAEYLARVKPTVLERLDGEVPAGPLSEPEDAERWLSQRSVTLLPPAGRVVVPDLFIRPARGGV